MKVLFITVQELVLLERRLAKEPLGAVGTDKLSVLLLLLSGGVHVVLVALQYGLEKESLTTEITDIVPSSAMETFMKFKIIFVVELFSALVTREFGADFMLEF